MLIESKLDFISISVCKGKDKKNVPAVLERFGNYLVIKW